MQLPRLKGATRAVNQARLDAVATATGTRDDPWGVATVRGVDAAKDRGAPLRHILLHIAALPPCRLPGKKREELFTRATQTPRLITQAVEVLRVAGGKIDAALRSRWAKSAPRAGKTPTKTKTKTTKKAIVKS